MGYSCTTAANDTLSVIRHTFNQERSSNVLTLDGKRFFYEVGRENADGAITGTLFRFTDDGNAYKSGNFRINADGSIARFPGLTAKQKQDVQRTLETTDRQRIRSWAYGTI